MAEENECMICFGPGRLKMNSVFQIPMPSRDTRQCCAHTYCAPCMEEYLATMPNLFTCAIEGCRASCDTVYALKWVKGRNRLLYEEMSIELSKTLARKPAKVLKAELVVDNTLEKFVSRTKARQCPGCKHLVERRDGCNQMSCICGTYFCYCCGYRNGSRELQAFHSGGTVQVEKRCDTCKSRHEIDDCPITACPNCHKIGHSLKNCPTRVTKACIDCGHYDDHSVTICSKKLLEKRLKEESEHKVEKLKYVGDYIPSNSIYDPETLDDDHEDDYYYHDDELEYSNYIKVDSEPVSLLAFVISK